MVWVESEDGDTWEEGWSASGSSTLEIYDGINEGITDVEINLSEGQITTFGDRSTARQICRVDNP